jgi:hypothetical protein
MLAVVLDVRACLLLSCLPAYLLADVSALICWAGVASVFCTVVLAKKKI